MNRLLLSLLFISSLNAVHAATLLEMYSVEDGVTRVWIDDNYAHFVPNHNQQSNQTEANQAGEMLLDLKNRKTYIVDHKEKVALELPVNENHGQPAHATTKMKVAIDKKGSGPAVAGFATDRYTFSANGTLCNEILFSKALLGNKHVMAFFQALYQAPSSSDESNKKDICDIAANQADVLNPKETLTKYGVGMRSTDNSGKVEFEIRAIKDNVTPPANFLGIPAGYKVMTMTEMVQQMQKNAGMK